MSSTFQKACCAPPILRENGSETTAKAGAAEELAVDFGARQCAVAALKFEWISLLGGDFWMGEDGPQARAEDGEGPVRLENVAPFRMAAVAVTNRQFEQFVAATGYRTEAENWGWSYVFHRHLTEKAKQQVCGNSGDAPWWLGVEGASWKAPEGPGSNLKRRLDFPVVHVSWNDATTFAQWAGVRLPCEREWEYAARGGLERQLYTWGNELTPKNKSGKPVHRMNVWQGKFPQLDTGADGHIGLAPAQSYEPNGFGLYNMTGNAWEWCEDWFLTPLHREESLKLIKGGSFLCHASYCNRYRPAARTGNTPESTTSHCGFRVVCDG